MACPYCGEGADTCNRILKAEFCGDNVKLTLEMYCEECEATFRAEVFCDEPDWGAQQSYTDEEWAMKESKENAYYGDEDE